jgi:hypothetical protein
VGTRLLDGRSFTEHDTEDAPKVVVVSQGLARRLWPGQSALGKRLHTNGAKADFKDGTFVDVEWQTVVGVVEDARYRGIQNPRPDVYLSYGQAVESTQYFVIRTTGNPAALTAAVREEARALDPDAEVGNVTSLTALVDRALAPWRFTSALLIGFAFAGLVLTATGLFAVLHHLVSSRTREIAVRMALGAAPQRMRSFILGEGLRVTLLGLLPGIGLSLVLARFLSALLYEVGERDPGSYLAERCLSAWSRLPRASSPRAEPLASTRRRPCVPTRPRAGRRLRALDDLPRPEVESKRATQSRRRSATSRSRSGNRISVGLTPVCSRIGTRIVDCRSTTTSNAAVGRVDDEPLAETGAPGPA